MAVRDALPSQETFPLVLFSHASGTHRRQSTFLCTHLSSHGYVVAGLDHSETIATELAPTPNETPTQKLVREENLVSSRVPDLIFLLNEFFRGSARDVSIGIDFNRIGIVGHSLGGWAALATPDVEPRIAAIAALAPAGASQRKEGIPCLTLDFNWLQAIPTLFLVAENDTFLPLLGMHELFEKTPATKFLMCLRKADHCHFMDNVEEVHEIARNMKLPGAQDMQPIGNLISGLSGHIFTRALALCHLDSALKGQELARVFWEGDVQNELAKRGLDVIARSGRPESPKPTG